MDDSAMYTGVDGELDGGVFGNEIKNQEIERIEQEQDRLIKELTPKLKDIIAMIDSERAIAIQFVSDYVDATSDDDVVLRGELKAAARYRKYLDELKTKFALALGEAQGKDND